MGSISGNDMYHCDMCDSKINNSSFNGGSLHGTNICSSHMNGGSCNGVLLSDCSIQTNIGYELIWDVVKNYNEQINLLKQQNEFLLKLLVNKGILENENEVQELIDAHKLANKLSEEDKNGTK